MFDTKHSIIILKTYCLNHIFIYDHIFSVPSRSNHCPNTLENNLNKTASNFSII